MGPRGNLVEAGAGQRGDDRLPRGLLVVPLERDLSHEVRVRVLDPLVPAESAGEPADAALAAHARDLDGGARSHARDAIGAPSRSRSSRSARPSSSGSWVAHTTVVPVSCASWASSPPISS